MPMLKLNKILIASLLIIVSSFHSYADEFHYINNNVGDRASGMAGAYTAVSDDSDGCYYNPAGIAIASGNKFSASVNAVNMSKKTYKGVFTGTSGGDKDWEQESFGLMPNYFGIIQKFNAGMFGFSYASPDSFDRQQKQTFHNIDSTELGTISRYTINMNDLDKAYLFGPSYAQSISDSFSVGVTLYYYYRDTQVITNQLLEAASGSEYIINSYKTKTEHGIQPIIGVLWEPIDKLAIGVTFSKRLITSSDFKLQNIENEVAEPANIVLTSFTSSEKTKNPLTTSLGIAWFHSPSLLFSADFKFFEEVEDKEYVCNVAFGTEYYPYDSLAIRAGVFTDLANTPDISSSTYSLYSESIDLYGASCSFTFFTKRSSITLGFVYSFGSGDSQPFGGKSYVYDVDYNNLAINLSTSFNY